MSKLEFLIEKLSKSSPEAVNTLTSSSDNIVEYLHIETDIEKRYLELLEENRNKKSLIFLCGSSGDGKSAIINRHIHKYQSFYNFHVDATHSFSPDQSALDALSNAFKEFEQSDQSLVVGINIGIMINFINEVNDEFEQIQEAIQNFLNQKLSNENIFFINFEDYPKFYMEDNNIKSPFIKNIFKRITQKTEDNPFYNAYIEDIDNQNLLIEHKNLQLLSNEHIQNNIIHLLVISNLKYNQFLTSRSLLDFIYTLLSSNNLLIDELFQNKTNEIIENISKEDPTQIRSFEIDKFIIERENKQTDKETTNLINHLNNVLNMKIFNDTDAKTLIRTIYLIQGIEFDNYYINEFRKYFTNQTLIEFLNLLTVHQKFEQSNMRSYSDIYKRITNAIFKYVNKNNPQYTSKKYLKTSHNNKFSTYGYLNLSHDSQKLKNLDHKELHYFPLYLLANDKPIHQVNINFNMLQMINQINEGYRPNKHERNAIIMFEELVEAVIDIANKSNLLLIDSGDNVMSLNKGDLDIEVNYEI